MRIALISDIHGNAVALEAALADIAADGIDQIVCLGDVAATGPQPREVLARVRALGCPVVMGNTDDWFLRPDTSEARDERTRHFQTLEHWCAAQLTDDDRAFVRTFQPTVRLALGLAGTLLGYHGSPRSYSEPVLPTTPDDAIDQMLAGVQPSAAVYAGGHTHQQMVRRHRSAILLNPGSVGLALDRVPPADPIRNAPWAEYAVVEAESDRLRIALRRVAFDLDRWAQAVRDSGMPDATWWIDGRSRDWT
jgi:predicted phosphodiesterase